MSSKNTKSKQLEAAHDAAIGYVTVVLGIMCFLLVLSLVVLGVRFVVGFGNANAANTATATATATSGTHR